MSRASGVIALLLALALPALLAVNLVRAAGTPAARLEAGLLRGPALLAQAGTGGGRSTTRQPGLVTGVLYTRGKAEIDWNGARFVVQDGSYAYVGGETVRMAPDAIGLLKLPGGGSIFLCGGSSARLTGDGDVGYRHAVFSGSNRVQMPAGIAFTVQANDTVVRPSGRAGPGGSPVEVEVMARRDGGCLVCELRSGIVVTAGDQQQAAGAVVGRVIEVAAPADGSTSRIGSRPIPPALMQAVASGKEDEPAYLCRCEDLNKELDTDPEEALRVAGSETASEAESAPVAVEVETEATDPQVPPGESGPVTAEAAADTPPPVAPPDAPPAAVADASAPDPFDPNVLPPPAAGEPSDPVVVVAPPGVPSFGTGGGGGGGPVASPS